jgi:hypothetical protein
VTIWQTLTYILILHERLLTSKHEDSVRLYCTVPTWSPSSDICMHLRLASSYRGEGGINDGTLGIDLHDLYTLRSRSLHFIHDLVNSLRESGVRVKLDGDYDTTQTFSEL